MIENKLKQKLCVTLTELKRKDEHGVIHFLRQKNVE